MRLRTMDEVGHDNYPHPTGYGRSRYLATDLPAIPAMRSTSSAFLNVPSSFYEWSPKPIAI